MFHAGAVMPSSLFLLQLLTGPCGERAVPSVVLDELDPPVSAGLRALSFLELAVGSKVEEPILLELLVPVPRAALGALKPPFTPAPPVGVPADFFGPIVVGILFGAIKFATRLKATRH